MEYNYKSLFKVDYQQKIKKRVENIVNIINSNDAKKLYKLKQMKIFVNIDFMNINKSLNLK